MLASRIGAAAEGDRSDCPGCVTADAGQLHQGFDFLWQLTLMLGDEQPRGCMKLPGAAVVAEAFPQPQHLLLVGCGE